MPVCFDVLHFFFYDFESSEITLRDAIHPLFQSGLITVKISKYTPKNTVNIFPEKNSPCLKLAGVSNVSFEEKAV